MEDVLKIYADGSCIGNPWPWWYAAILMYQDSSKTISWAQWDTTNNRMELTAVIQALKAIKKDDVPIEFYVDSSYVRDWITKYIDNWQSNWWKTADRNDVKNQDLWQELLELTKRYKNLSRNWVKWHSTNHMNNLVDKIAKKQAQSI